MMQDPSNSSRSSSDSAVDLLSLEDKATRGLGDPLVDHFKTEPHNRSENYKVLYPEQDVNIGSASEQVCITSDDGDQMQHPISDFHLGDDGICATCRKLFEEIAEATIMKRRVVCNDSRRHYESTMAVQESSQNGCRICTLFIEAYGHEAFKEDSQSPKEAIGKEAIGNTESPDSPRIWLDNQKDRRQWTIGLRLPKSRRADWDKMMLFFPMAEGDLMAPVNEIMRPLTSNYLSIAKDWLKECVDQHERCVEAKPQILPTRLLCLNRNSIRLVHTVQNLGMKLQYATLSHSWGSIEFFRLCRENFQNLQECVPEQKLTKTFRDAVYITRSLGLEYLWIDSLCIIQDDEQDWDRESAFMSDVYGGSTINIAAADSFDGNGGCLYDDVTTRTECKSFRYRLRMPGLQKDRIWELAPIYLYPDCTSWSYLASRAWALQERLLAPRTLHFSKTDILWECREKDACSLYPDRLPQSLCGHNSYREKASLASTWDLIVGLYSAAKLTRYSDKLVALSGLAHAVQSETGDEYVAGMWRKNLEHQLLWSENNSQNLLPRPKPYRAPTWSWAALDVRVSFLARRSSNSLYARVHSVYTQPTISNPLGQISRGLLTLSCTVLMRGTTTSKDDLDIDHQDVFECQAYPVALSFGGDTTVARIEWDADEDHSGLLYFLPILESSLGADISRGFKAIMGLVLRKNLQNENIVQYSRLGRFFFDYDIGLADDDDRKRRNYQNVLAIMRKQKQTTPRSDFSGTLGWDEKLSEECHLIEII